MPLFESAVNATTFIATNIINNINTSGILEPVIHDLVVPVVKKFTGKRVRIVGTWLSAARRGGKAYAEYQRGGLRSPKFWLRSGATLSTATSGVLQTYSGLAALSGCKAEWAYDLGMGIETAVQGMEGKLDPLSIP